MMTSPVEPALPVAVVTAYLGFGGNIGDVADTFARAIAMLNDTDGVRVLRRASLYHTEPVGYADQPWFTNTVVAIETHLDAHTLMARCLEIERLLGRIRSDNPALRNGPRTMDIDLLLYGEYTIQGETLSVPHPRMHERAFVMDPLNELRLGMQLAVMSAGASISH